ncbi:MAG: DUF1971 domain-containing protein [Deltaproteobacteria bacterium]|nr:DUF1971 domain-containing protein [Deltaproteobacteria bacterium]
MTALPADAAPYRRTPTFTEETLPAGLRANHSTRAGVWALIVVEEGEVDYHVGGSVERLRPGRPGVAPPEVTHHLAPVGPLRVHVEFWSRERGAHEGGGPRA